MATQYSNTNSSSFTDDQMKLAIRHAIFENQTHYMDVISRRNTYVVYECTNLGMTLHHQFLSRREALDFAEDCDATSKVYVFKTKCIRVEQPESDGDGEVEVHVENDCGYCHEDEDPDYVPNGNEELEHIAEEYASDYGEEEHSDDSVTLEDMFYRKYGRGFLLVPPSNSEHFGRKYFLGGWWIPAQSGWFFKLNFRDELDHRGAVFATKSSSGRRSGTSRTQTRTQSGTHTQTGSSHSDDDFTGMSFTRYGKGFILTCDESDSRFGTKYLSEHLSDGGFWNTKANGWIFRHSHREYLVDHGAQFIKSEDDFETSDTTITSSGSTASFPAGYRPKFVRYGKGWFLKESTQLRFNSSRKYLEGGFYMPNKCGWFFRNADKDAAMARFS